VDINIFPPNRKLHGHKYNYIYIHNEKKYFACRNVQKLINLKGIQYLYVHIHAFRFLNSAILYFTYELKRTQHACKACRCVHTKLNWHACLPADMDNRIFWKNLHTTLICFICIPKPGSYMNRYTCIKITYIASYDLVYRNSLFAMKMKFKRLLASFDNM
jgi:hypothetical protein